MIEDVATLLPDLNFTNSGSALETNLFTLREATLFFGWNYFIYVVFVRHMQTCNKQIRNLVSCVHGPESAFSRRNLTGEIGFR